MSWLWPHEATRPTSQRPGRADWLTSDKEAVMRVVVLISWIVTALAGATLFGIWLARGGLRRQGPAASRT
jgi:hypothetical protein